MKVDLCLAFTCLYSLCELGIRYIKVYQPTPPSRNGVGIAALPGLAFTCLYSLCGFGYIIPPRRNGVGMAALPGLASGFERAGVATGGASWQVLWRGAFHNKNHFGEVFG